MTIEYVQKKKQNTEEGKELTKKVQKDGRIAEICFCIKRGIIQLKF